MGPFRASLHPNPPEKREIPRPPSNPATRRDPERIRLQLRRWQERLLDLSRANPLLGLNRSRVSRLRVAAPAPPELFRALAVEERALRLPRVVRPAGAPPPGAGEECADAPRPRVDPGDLTFDLDPEDLGRKLRRLYDNARTSVEERGVTTLHAAFGLLRWEDPHLEESLSPLLLVPCEIEYPGPSAPMRLKAADEEIQVNPSLALYLKERHRLEIPPFPEDPKPETLEAFLAELAARVCERGWTVSDEAWISTFSFESLVLHQDLKLLAGTAAENPVVAALARAVPLPEASEALGEDQLDEAALPDPVPIPVLPTDSSQLRALALARGGRHLVVHGPPGTGKSQTIANLIADALGQGRTVLFVSAKMAALEVVHRRLTELGLGRFCLEAHSTKAGKARVIDELRRTLVEAEASPGGDAWREPLEDLLRVRQDLNAYVRALHGRRAPLNLSPYEAIGKSERLRSAPDVQGPLPWPDPLAAGRAELDAALEALRDLGAQAEVFDRREAHPWRGLTLDPARPWSREILLNDLRRAEETARTLQDRLARLEPLLGPLPAAGLEDVRRLADPLGRLPEIGDLPPDWPRRDPRELEDTASFLEDAASKAAEESSLLEEHGKTWKAPFPEIARLLEPLATRFSGPLRFLRPSYWKWRRGVRERLQPGLRPGLAQLRQALLNSLRLERLQSWFREHGARIASEAGPGRERNPAELRGAAAGARVAARLRAAGAAPAPGTASPSPDLRRTAAEVADLARRPDVEEAFSRLEAAWPKGFVDGAGPRRAPLAALGERCREALDARERLHEWTVLQHTLNRCRELRLDRFVEALGNLGARQAAAAFERRFFNAWADAALEAEPPLARFLGPRREEQIARFRELDRNLGAAWLARIRAAASEGARRVAGARGDLGTSSEVGLLKKELQKQRRFKPLRKLFSEIPNVLQALKPCMMMSPLSVSTFLEPGKFAFDLVVFDEASQLPTPEGIPSILRGRQIVVAGDSKQLPPTSFFTASVIFDEESPAAEEAESLEPLDSLLDDAIAVHPFFDQTFLRWHYRSRDERLIAFSNHAFYRERPLITFPAPRRDAEDQGVRWVHVEDGVWDRGGSRTNRPEARRVVQVVEELADRHPERSLGVVTMNVSQREAVEELLDARFLERPDLRERLGAHASEPFFVKALENIQGDERDAIVISVGYGRTASGTLAYHFGPLNQEGGWRRLNVLVTRARWQTVLVSSLRAADLSGINPSNRGALALRDFMDYAERGGRLPPAPAGPTGAETNDFEDSVAEALRSLGYTVDAQVGAGGYRIDLAVRDPRDPGRYLLGVECDGATYHGTPTARDRDVLREGVLRNLGWRLHRIWSTDWFRDRRRAIERAASAIERARQEPPGPPAPPPPVPAVKNDPPPSALPPPVPRRHPPGEAYRKYFGRGDRRILLDPELAGPLADQIARIAAVEGPIHPALLSDRLKEINGVSRLGENVSENIERAIRSALRRGCLERSAEGFLRLPGQALETFRRPGDGVQRPAAWIPIEEIERAVLHLVEDQFGCHRSALPAAVARLFGWERVSPDFVERVGTAVDRLLDGGRLTASGPNVTLA